MTWTDRIFVAAAGKLLPRTRWQSFIITPARLLACPMAKLLRIMKGCVADITTCHARQTSPSALIGATRTLSG